MHASRFVMCVLYTDLQDLTKYIYSARFSFPRVTQVIDNLCLHLFDVMLGEFVQLLNY